MKKMIEVNWKKTVVFLVYSVILLILFVMRVQNKEIQEYVTEGPTTIDTVTGNNFKGTEYKQYFSLEKNSYLDFVSIQFATFEDTIQTKGFHFQCYTEDGSKIYETKIKKEDLQDNQYYSINVDSEVKCKSGRYYFVLEGLDEPDSDSIPATVWCSLNGHEGDVLYINGEEQSITLNAVYRCSKVVHTSYLYIGILFIISCVLCLVTFKNVTNKTIYLVVNIIVFLANFVFLEWMIENLGLSGIELTTDARYLTYAVILSVQMMIFAICGTNVYLSIIITDIVFAVFALVNYFVMLYRGVPVVPSDIFAIGTLTEVADSYKITFTLYQMIIIMCLVLWLQLLIRLMLDEKYHLEWKLSRSVIFRKVGTMLVSFGVGMATFVWLSDAEVLKRSGVEAYIWDRNGGYYGNGPVMNFMVNMQYATIKKPENYSKELAEQYLAEYSKVQAEDSAEKPNIILIMNESLADFESYETNDMQFSQDPLPYIHSMTENTIKGNCYVSVFGGGTANSELEALTSHSVAFFPVGSVAYSQFPRTKITGLASCLKENNYTTVAIHQYSAESWNRVKIYEAMGFDAYYSETDFDDGEYVRTFLSDKTGYDKIIELYENKKDDEKLFCFNVTIQGHGGYNTGATWEEPIVVENGEYVSTNEYLSLTHISDRAFQYLVEYFEKEEEPTLIFMFGDHQPSLETEFFEALLGKSMTDLTLEEVQKKYVTPYIIWANYDIDEKSGENISTNQIAMLVKEYANINFNSYDRFIQEFSKEIPIINANGYQDREGTWHEFDEMNEYTELINKYNIIQYGIYCDGLDVS